MMFTIGVFILLLSIIIDDFTTLILLHNGFGLFETNPLYRFMPFSLYIISMVLFYLLIIITFKFLINKYQWFYKKKAIMYKLYDIFIFLACLIIITISFGKMEAGYNNLQILKDYKSNPGYYQDLLSDVDDLKQSNPIEYNNQLNIYYATGTLQGLSYLKMIFNCLCAYLFFRVGYKVQPWYLTD